MVIVKTAAGEIELERDTTSMIGMEGISDGVVVVKDKGGEEEVGIDESREGVVVVGVVIIIGAIVVVGGDRETVEAHTWIVSGLSSMIACRTTSVLMAWPTTFETQTVLPASTTVQVTVITR